MRTIRFRVVGDIEKVNAVIALVHEFDKVDRVEEVADEGQDDHQRDDSSSLGLVDDEGADFHDIEVHALDAQTAEDVRNRVEVAARDLDVVVEFVDTF